MIFLHPWAAPFLIMGWNRFMPKHYTDAEIDFAISIRSAPVKSLSWQECLKFKSAMLHVFAVWDCEKGWVQQYHLGALRNNNTRMLQQLGADTGWDSIGDFSQASALSKFLDRLIPAIN